MSENNLSMSTDSSTISTDNSTISTNIPTNKPPNQTTQDSTSDEYFDQIKKLKEGFNNIIDERVCDPNLIESHNEYLETKLKFIETIKVEPLGNVNFNRKISFLLPKFYTEKSLNSPQKMYAYKNLRLVSNKHNKLIRSCELEIGGARIDTVYGRILKTLRHLYELDDTNLPFYFNRKNSYLPIAEWHNYRIIFDFYDRDEIKLESENSELEKLESIMDNFDLFVDMYEIEPKSTINHMIYQISYNGGELIGTSNCCKIKLCNNLIHTHLLVVPENYDLVNYKLQFANTNKYADLVIDLDKCEKYDGVIIIPFVKSFNYADIQKHGINFSSIKSAIEIINASNNSEESVHHTFGICINVARIQGEMYGIQFGS